MSWVFLLRPFAVANTKPPVKMLQYTTISNQKMSYIDMYCFKKELLRLSTYNSMIHFILDS